MVSLSQNDLLNIERELCRRSLAQFVRRAWHVLEPGNPYIHGWHVDAVCEHLEAVTNGDLNRLLINIPPGTMKSTLVSVFWPAWEWGPCGMAHKRIIGASHEQGIATRDTLKMRRLVMSNWYQSRWPIRLTGDQNQKTYYENESTGFRQACAVASMTGKRGDCLVGDAIISTDKGDFPIREIVEQMESCNVLSSEVDTGKLVYRPVKAVARRTASEIYRVHTSCGSVVECTGDHRIYTARGYVEARLLSPDDILVRSLRHGCEAQRLRDEEGREAREKGSFLWAKLFGKAGEHQAWQHRSVLQRVQQEDTQGAATVFGRLPGSRSAEMEAGCGIQNADMSVRAVRQDISSQDAKAGASVLLSPVRQSRPLKPYSGREESDVAGWSGCSALQVAQPASVSEGEAGDLGEGWSFVRVLRRESDAVRPSHGHGYVEQHLGEPCDDVQGMPCDVAQLPAGKTGYATVTMVERVSRPELVYDLQVEGTQCFFANGILVHNCVIWDDPHSAEGALSQAHRETALRVFQETLPTRLNSPEKSAIIIVMQRLHENDVSGYILANDLGYEHLCLPMEFEPDRRCTTSIGFADPRTDEGELLFPERFPAEVVERDKKVMGSMAVAGQFQQRPAPRSGGFFRWENLTVCETSPRDIVQTVRYWDKAGTDGGGAHTAGVKMGRAKDGRWYVLNVVRGQWAAGERERIIRATAEVDGRDTVIWIEQEPGSGGKESAESTIRNLAGFKVYAERATGDKSVRAEPYAVQVEAGNIVMVRGEWNQAFLDEHKTFPVGKYKDQIDAAGGAFNRLAKPVYSLDNVI